MNMVLNMSRQLQEHHWPSQSVEDRDWAPAAVAGEGEGQAPEGFPEMVEPGDFNCAGNWPHFSLPLYMTSFYTHDRKAMLCVRNITVT